MILASRFSILAFIKSCVTKSKNNHASVTKLVLLSTTINENFFFCSVSISNSIELFTSMCMVILLQSIILKGRSHLRNSWYSTLDDVAATSVTLPHFRQTKWLLYATLAIESLTLISVIFVYLQFKKAKCILRKMHFLKCMSSSPVPKNGSLDMAANEASFFYKI